ncbi:DNA polymerase III subunit alpha, partial [Candidatus Aerophobetes bacterium]|nr:DNA polymerase III subunit alpha [Candidatus Aerophobetes bacterium]
MQFYHLHVHSCFSFGEGASTPEELVEVAKELKMSYLALTDKDGLYGAVRFYRKAQKEGIQPIIGAELLTEKGFPLVLLAKNNKGYSNLSQLITASHLGSSNGVFARFDVLERFSQDLFALSGGPGGELSWCLKMGKETVAEKLARRYIRIFGRENFIIELQDHLLPEECSVNDKLFELACKLHLLVVATNNVYYANKSQHELHQVLARAARIVHHRSITEKPNPEYYLKSYCRMASVFTKYPFALFNTHLLASECNVELPLGKIQAPCFLNKNNEHFHLTKSCFQNLPQKYHPPSKKATQRLIKELRIIEEKGFSSYFLLVQDIVNFARKKGIRCQARGSASGSIVAYLSGISQIDPIEHDLLFERFLNPERVDFPDIDLDFDSRKRDDVMDYVFNKYGNDKVALVATVPTFRARGAIREAGRALGLEYASIDKLIQFLPYLPANRITDALNSLPELRQSKIRDFQELVAISCEMNGL